jgi:hypothetical protein
LAGDQLPELGRFSKRVGFSVQWLMIRIVPSVDHWTVKGVPDSRYLFTETKSSLLESIHHQTVGIHRQIIREEQIRQRPSFVAVRFFPANLGSNDQIRKQDRQAKVPFRDAVPPCIPLAAIPCNLDEQPSRLFQTRYRQTVVMLMQLVYFAVFHAWYRKPHANRKP